ncbi:MAG: hypothetical protein RLZZ66_1106 [Pseudomonadota bacterium]|jgi:hypothetical protein
MFKRIVLFGLAALFYATQSPSFAESYDVQQQQRMENEINALRTFVVELEERIKQLEREQTGKAKGGGEAVSSNETKNEPKLEPNWRDKRVWALIKVAMSTEKVKGILGRPVRIDDLGNGHQKYVYQGEVIGSGIVNGNIEFYENRVYEINVPNF